MAVRYSSEQITKALAELVAHHGNVNATADCLIDDEFQVPAATLRRWRDDTHAEQYARLRAKHGSTLEEEAVNQARETIRLAGEKQRGLLNKIDPEKTPADQLAALLKAATDAKSKTASTLLALTGRPTNPTGDQSTGEVVKLLTTMAEKGFLSMAPGVSIEPVKVPNEAEVQHGRPARGRRS